MAGTTAGLLELNAQTSMLEKQIYYFTGGCCFFFNFILFLSKKMSLFFLSCFLLFPSSLFGLHLFLYGSSPLNWAARTHSGLPPTARQRIGGNDESPQPAFSLLG